MADLDIKEIRRIRDEAARRFNYDAQAMGRSIMRRQKKNKHQIIKLSKKNGKPGVSNAALPADSFARGLKGRKKSTRNGLRKTRRKDYQVGSGNVFADMGVPFPDETMAKAQIARAICLLAEKEGLSQLDVAKRMGVDQPAVSRLMRGNLAEFSMGRLLRLLMRLGYDVDVSVHSEKSRNGAAFSVAVN